VPGTSGPATYDLIVRGPNGFLQRYAGAIDGTADARLKTTPQRAEIHLTNRAATPQVLTVALDEAYAADSPLQTVSVASGATAVSAWSLARSDGWYDLTVRSAADRSFLCRFAGSTGSRNTDPAIGRMRLTA